MYTDPYYLAFIRTNQWMHAVEMQANRIIGPTIDPNMVGMIKYRLDWNQRQRDLDFFLIALNRLRIAVVSLNKKIKDKEISNSLKEFNKDIPDIKDLRDIGEHFDEYDLSQGNLNKKKLLTNETPNMGWGEEDASVNYRGKKITVNKAKDSARKLHKIVMNVLAKNGVKITLDDWPLVVYK